MNEEEKFHCREIIESVDNYKISSRPLYYGFPSCITNDLTSGYALGSIMCIKREVGFSYYLFTVDERGNVGCIDFEKYIPIYEKTYGEVIFVDAFIYFLLNKIDAYNEEQSNQIYIHSGHVVKAHLSENGKYRFELLHGYGCNMGYENACCETGYGEAIYDKIKCPCKHEFFFCDKNIPNGSKYEVQCPNCKALLMRKKVINNNENI